MAKEENNLEIDISELKQSEQEIQSPGNENSSQEQNFDNVPGENNVELDDLNSNIPVDLSGESMGDIENLPTPPTSQDGETVDTSKLDAELEKIKNNTNEEISDDNESDDFDDDDDFNDFDDEDSDDEDSEIPENSSEEINELDQSDDSKEIDSSLDINSEEINNEAEGLDDQPIAESGEVSAETNTAEEVVEDINIGAEEIDNAVDQSIEDGVAAEEIKIENEAQEEVIENIGVDSGEIDPEFAEKTIENITADTTAPKTENISADQVEKISADSIDYKEPEIMELHKKPELESNSVKYSSVPVDKMPIILTFEAGRKKITIGELGKIKEGYTFECENPANSPVTICANDTPVGTGELLDIDGRIGVRILEFYDK